MGGGGGKGGSICRLPVKISLLCRLSVGVGKSQLTFCR